MKIHNFCAGPSILPSEVFDEASNAVKDLNGSGLSLLEISHRSHAFVEIMDEARDLSLELLGLSGNDYTSIFLQGGASSQFLMTELIIEFYLLILTGKSKNFLITQLPLL